MESEDKPSQQTPVELGTKLTEGILIAVASAGAYLYAFNFEMGFANAFNIPDIFISVNLTSVLIMAAKLITMVLLFQPYVHLVLLLLVEVSPKFRTIAGLFTIVGTGIAIVIYLMGWENWRTWITIAIALALIVAVILVFPIFTQRSGTYFEKLERQRVIDGRSKDTWSLLKQSFGANTTRTILIFFTGYVLCFFAGWGEALNQKQFLVTNTSPEMAVLRIYGENAIAAPLDRAAKEIKNQFVILKLAETPELVLTLEKIGPLRSVSPATASNITSTATITASATQVTQTTTVSPTTQITQTTTVISPSLQVTHTLIAPTDTPLPATTSTVTP